MLSGRDRGPLGGDEILCQGPYIVYISGVVGAGGVQQGVQPGCHKGGVDAGSLVERLLRCICGLLDLALGSAAWSGFVGALRQGWIS